MNKPKVVLFTCDRCQTHNTLVAYHNMFGWYCRDCLAAVRDRMIELVDYMDFSTDEINKNLGVDPKRSNNAN